VLILRVPSSRPAPDCARSAYLGEPRPGPDLDPPALVVREVQVQPVQPVAGDQIDKAFDVRDREEVPGDVEHDAAPLVARPLGAFGDHALTAPAVKPKAIFRCTRMKKMMTGIAVNVAPAISAPQSVCLLEPRKYDSHTVTVCFDWSFNSTRAKMYSFQHVMNAKTDVATRPGAISGSRIFTNAPGRLLPSTSAASSSSRGMPTMKPRSIQIENGRTNVM